MSSKLAKLIAVALAIAAVLRVQLTRRRIAERSSHSDDDASVPSSMRKPDAVGSRAVEDDEGTA
jgi:hypothetical protein